MLIFKCTFFLSPLPNTKGFWRHKMEVDGSDDFHFSFWVDAFRWTVCRSYLFVTPKSLDKNTDSRLNRWWHVLCARFAESLWESSWIYCTNLRFLSKQFQGRKDRRNEKTRIKHKGNTDSGHQCRDFFFRGWGYLVIVPKFWDRISKQNKHVEFERLGTAESIGK